MKRTLAFSTRTLLVLICSLTCGPTASGGQPQTTATLSVETPEQKASQKALPKLITSTVTVAMDYDVSGTLLKHMVLDVAIAASYASLSVYAENELIVDNLDIPSAGSHRLNAMVTFTSTGRKHLRFRARSADITLNAVRFDDISNVTPARFSDISDAIGLKSEATFKYSGPSVGDVDNDGDYDFVLNNHNFVPTQLVTNNGSGSVTVERLFPMALDFHGSAVGDYDADGDLDIIVALGGANATSPTSYSLLRNNSGVFENVSEQAGINTPARGRAPRWVDLDLDGKLDLVLVNAKTPNHDGPQQLFYRNNGDGSFSAVRVPNVDSQMGERILVNDFNRDGKDDILLFSPLTLWQGHGDFTFTDVTSQWLPKVSQHQSEVLGAADVDVNNDGLYDLYLARGKVHYELSRKSIDFNPVAGKLDVRDDGEQGTTAIRFTASNSINLSHLNLTYRQYEGNFPIFLGVKKVRRVVKATGFQRTQLPAEMSNADNELKIAPNDASGWPETRDENGIYIGHVGNGQWQAEWVRNKAIYWNITFTLSGLADVAFDWQPNNRNVQDMLLINKGDRFEVAADSWNIPKGGNHWGVTHGDFNNDGWNDLFIYRYGFLTERVTDLLLLNTGNNSFHTTTQHDARDRADPGHGDMGQAFDFDNDGGVDLLNGSEEEGHWYLYKNQMVGDGKYVLIEIDYSPRDKVDPISAEVVLTTESNRQYVKRVGSAGEVFSQGVINTLHFGLGNESRIKHVQIRWRNGETATLPALHANGRYSTTSAP